MNNLLSIAKNIFLEVWEKADAHRKTPEIKQIPLHQFEVDNWMTIFTEDKCKLLAKEKENAKAELFEVPNINEYYFLSDDNAVKEQQLKYMTFWKSKEFAFQQKFEEGRQFIEKLNLQIATLQEKQEELQKNESSEIKFQEVTKKLKMNWIKIAPTECSKAFDKNSYPLLAYKYLEQLTKLRLMRTLIKNRFPWSYETFSSCSLNDSDLCSLYGKLEKLFSDTKSSIYRCLFPYKLNHVVENILNIILDCEKSNDLLFDILSRGPFSIDIEKNPEKDSEFSFSFDPSNRRIMIKEKAISQDSSNKAELKKDLLLGILFQLGNLALANKFIKNWNKIALEIKKLHTDFFQSKLSWSDFVDARQRMMDERACMSNELECLNTRQFYFPILKEGMQECGWNTNVLKDLGEIDWDNEDSCEILKCASKKSEHQHSKEFFDIEWSTYLVKHFSDLKKR